MQNNDITYEVLGFTLGGEIQVEKYMESDYRKNGASFSGVEEDVSLREVVLLY